MATVHPSHQSFRKEGYAGDRDVHEESVKELISEFFEQGRVLLRSEAAIAKAELKLEAKKASQVGLFGGAAGIVGLLFAMSMTAFLIIALAHVMPSWAAALLVTIGLGAGAAVLGLMAKKRAEHIHGPKRTIQHLKEDGVWAKDMMHAAKSQLRANG